MLVSNAKILTPFRYVSEPVGRSIWIQPAIGRDSVDDDRGVPEDAEEEIVVLVVEAFDVGRRLETGLQAGGLLVKVISGWEQAA